jgi:hypothetical protein
MEALLLFMSGRGESMARGSGFLHNLRPMTSLPQRCGVAVRKSG